MTLQQTITIPADRRVYFELPRDIPLGEAKCKLIITPFRAPDAESQNPVEDAAWEAEILRKQAAAIAADPETQAILKRAAERAADPNRPKLSRLFGSCPGLFGDVDPVAYQRSIRDEWDD